MQTLRAWEIFICGDQIVFLREGFTRLVSLKKSLGLSIYREQVCVNLNPLWDWSGREKCWIISNLALILCCCHHYHFDHRCGKNHGSKSSQNRAAQPNSAAPLLPEASGKQPPPPPAAQLWGSTPKSDCWKSRPSKETRARFSQSSSAGCTRSWRQGVCRAPVLLHIYSYHTFYK